MAATELKMELEWVYTNADALRFVDSFKAMMNASLCPAVLVPYLMLDCRSVLKRVLDTADLMELSRIPVDARCVVSCLVALGLYTSEYGVHQPLNKAMREGDERTAKKLAPLICDLSTLLEALPQVKTVTFRGEQHLHPELRGDTITFRSFLSTTKELNACLGFVPGSGRFGTVFLVQGCNGRYVDRLSPNQEVLFPPRKKFHVISKMSPVVRSVLGLPYHVVTIREQGFIPTAEDVAKTIRSSEIFYESVTRFSAPKVRDVTDRTAPSKVSRRCCFPRGRRFTSLRRCRPLCDRFLGYHTAS